MKVVKTVVVKTVVVKFVAKESSEKKIISHKFSKLAVL